MTDAQTIIEVRDLEARYGEAVILTGVNFDIYRGEILAIIGGSGCGKTTLLRHLIGLRTPAAGSIQIDGQELSPENEAAFNEALHKIGVLFQGGALFGSMTLAENVALPILEYTDLPPAVVDTLVRTKLAGVDLGPYAGHLPSEISGGMVKRAALARALALNPEILFLDEPTAGLDPVTAAEIEDLVVRLNHSLGTTMVIITHSLNIIFKVAHRVIMLDRSVKGVIAQGDPQELKNSSPIALVRQFFNRQTKASERTPWHR
jgi:phospholipid/cholesterol/gamma-HCH transport system ATP-binding protein